MTNKNIFASNLKMYMALKGKSRNDVSRDLGISYYTVTDWVNGKKYPRMDKVEMLATYFNIKKSDLIEDRQSSKNGNKNPPEIELTEGEELLLDLFRKIPDDKKQMAIEMLKVALQVK